MAIPTADAEAGHDPARRADRGRAARRATTLAPGDYEIGFQRTNDILDEALEVFQRSSRSSMGIAGDVMIALFIANGDLVNAAAGTYLHAIIQPILIKYILEHYGENPGIQRRRHLVRQRRALRRHPQPRPGDRAADLPRRQADRLGGRRQPHDRDRRGRAGRHAGVGHHAASTRG